MTDPLLTHRVESWRFDLLSRTEAPLSGPAGLAGVQPGGSVSWNATATFPARGEIEVADLGQVADWLDLRIRVWQQVVGAEPWPLGTFCVTGFPERVTSTGRSWRLTLTDKLIRLDQDGIAETLALPAGTVVTSAVRAQIAAAGEASVAVTDSTKTLSTGKVWEAGTSRLRIINDLLATINYWSLRTDRNGRYTAAPYVAPGDRATVRDLTADAIVLAEWTREQDVASIPNRVVLVTSGTGDTPGLVSVAENNDPADRLSIPNRGVITAPDRSTTVDADSQATLDALAVRRLADLSAPAGMRTLAHASVPLDVNDVIAHKGTRGAVQEWSQRLTTGALMTTTVREV